METFMKLQFEQAKANTASLQLDIEKWTVEDNQSWGVFSTEGDIGSLLGNLLCGESTLTSGYIKGLTNNILQVSLSEQQRLLEQELANDDTDFLDRIDMGTCVYALIFQQCKNEMLTKTLIKQLNLTHLQDSGFKMLSTGETRRLMLARALANQPDFLVLDEPYVGLDVAHRTALSEFLTSISHTTQMMVIISREEEMPDWVSHVALFNHGTLDQLIDKKAWDNNPIIAQLNAQSQTQSEEMLALINQHRHQSKFENPIFELKNGKVAYTEKTIFSGANWRINKGEHWQVKGPNGCGKSTLLAMIFGDHPQCYSNHIHIFGRQRGSGETVWEIKQNIGMVSSALHLQYRVNCKVLDVILSGFYDSIGLYKQPTLQETKIAQEWLTLLHMDRFANTPFRELEYGQQRLILIARAIVKQPTLLILDEPYQGLDFLGRRLVKNTLELIAREHLSQLLYVSHYQEDNLDSIRNYLTFIPAKDGNGYQIILSESE